MSGAESEAKAALAEVQRLSPAYTVSEDRRTLAPQYRNAEDLERYLDGLRKAGLPE